MENLDTIGPYQSLKTRAIESIKKRYYRYSKNKKSTKTSSSNIHTPKKTSSYSWFIQFYIRYLSILKQLENLKTLMSLFLSIITIFILYFPNGAISILAREYQAMGIALRNRSYHLFYNVMDTSDLQFQLLSSFPLNTSFTIFVPIDNWGRITGHKTKK